MKNIKTVAHPSRTCCKQSKPLPYNIFGTSLACYLHSYHAKNILDWFIYSPVFQQQLGFWCKLLYTYPIILKLNRNDPRPKRLGSVHHRNLSRPKSPGRNDPDSVTCTATILKLFGLVYCPILWLKQFFFVAN